MHNAIETKRRAATLDLIRCARGFVDTWYTATADHQPINGGDCVEYCALVAGRMRELLADIEAK